MKREVKFKVTAEGKVKIAPVLRKLLVLIRALNQGQKRDFRKYIQFWGRKSERKYIVLYDVLQKFISSGKDETELLDFLRGRKKRENEPDEFLSASSYLFRKILESMRTTPDAAPHFNSLNAALQDIVFLNAKNLSAEGQDIAKDALKIARDLDKPTYEIELNFWKRRLDVSQTTSGNLDGLARWLTIQKKLIGELEEMMEYEALSAEIEIYLRKKVKLAENTEFQVQTLLKTLDAAFENRLGLRSKIRLFTALSHYFDLQYMLGTGKTESGLVKKVNAEKSLHFQEKAIEVFRKNKTFTEEEQDQFFNILGDYINRCMRFERTDLVEQLERELKGRENELVKYRYIAFYRLQHHLKLNEFRQAREYFVKHDVASGIEKFKHQIPENRLQSLRFTIGQIFYSLDDFDLAGNWFGQVASMRMEIKPDVVLVCKVLEIICLWEYGAFNSDPDTNRPVRNLRRSLVRARLMDDFLAKVLDGIEMVFRNARGLARSEFPQRLAEIKKEYEADKTKALFFMVLAWFDARLMRTSVNKEIVKYG